MKKVLIIPNRKYLTDCLELANKYDLGFEYNDFYVPNVLDNEAEREQIVAEYRRVDLPSHNTLHGAFYDVIPFSVDAKIREIADLRIKQSIDSAKIMDAKAVIFHTAYNSNLNSKGYVEAWLDTNEAYWEKVLKENPDMDIYLENTFESGPEILEKLSRRLCKYENYGVCFDYAHAALAETPVDTWAEALGKYVKHIHINDNDGKSDLHLAWGDGTLDREKFYECYEKYMQGATVLIETMTQENVKRSLEVLRTEGFLNE